MLMEIQRCMNTTAWDSSQKKPQCYSALYIGVLSADYFPDFLCCTTFLSNYFQLFRQINNGHVYDVPT